MFKLVGCMRDYSTCNQLVKETKEYKPLYLTLTDYKKAFDSVEHSAVIYSVQEYDLHVTFYYISIIG